MLTPMMSWEQAKERLRPATVQAMVCIFQAHPHMCQEMWWGLRSPTCSDDCRPRASMLPHACPRRGTVAPL